MTLIHNNLAVFSCINYYCKHCTVANCCASGNKVAKTKVIMTFSLFFILNLENTFEMV